MQNLWFFENVKFTCKRFAQKMQQGFISTIANVIPCKRHHFRHIIFDAEFTSFLIQNPSLLMCKNVEILTAAIKQIIGKLTSGVIVFVNCCKMIFCARVSQ